MVLNPKATQQVLQAEGYKLIDDAWDEHGRLTFIHGDDADRPFLKRLERTLQRSGWEKSKSELRTFRHPAGGELVEVEPGGAETNGHLLHYVLAPGGVTSSR